MTAKHELVASILEDMKRVKSCGSPTKLTVQLMRDAADHVASEDAKRAALDDEIARLQGELAKMKAENKSLFADLQKYMERCNDANANLVAARSSIEIAMYKLTREEG